MQNLSSQGKLAFIFPGQGSQAVSMLSDFAQNDIVQQTFKEASDALGYDLWQLIAQGPVEQLNQTNFTQQVLLYGAFGKLNLMCYQLFLRVIV